MSTVHDGEGLATRIGAFFWPSEETVAKIVADAEKTAKENIGLYKFKLVCFALVGYAFLYAVIAVLGALMVGILASCFHTHRLHVVQIKIAFVLGVVLLLILKSMWLKMERPEGLEIHREDAPKLFALIDELSREMNTRIDRVLVADFFNAAVIQYPRFGLFGGHENILELGLPYMQSTSLEHFKTTLVHELGHLSGNHGKVDAWIYKLRARWAQIIQTMREHQSFMYGVFTVFFCWYSPRFEAYSMTLARKHEIDADNDGARLCGAEHHAEDLVLFGLRARLMQQEVWPNIWRQAIESPTPPQMVYNQVAQQLREFDLDRETSQEWLRQALDVKVSSNDTHPPLSERLSACNQLERFSAGDPRVLEHLLRTTAAQSSAAELLLGANLSKYVKTISDTWAQAVADDWKYRHEELQSMRTRLEELEAKASEAELPVHELREVARCVYHIEGLEPSLNVYQRILELDPNDPIANYNIGMRQLRSDDSAGVQKLETAMKFEYEMIEDALRAIITFYDRHQQDGLKAQYEERLSTFWEHSFLASLEREGADDDDTFFPHEVSAEWVDNIRNQLYRYPEIKRAYLVRKKLEYFSEVPYYVLAVDAQYSGLNGLELRDELAMNLLNGLDMPGRYCVCAFDFTTKKLQSKIEAIESAAILDTKSAKTLVR